MFAAAASSAGFCRGWRLRGWRLLFNAAGGCCGCLGCCSLLGLLGQQACWASKAKNCKLRLETLRRNCKLSLSGQIWPDLASKAKTANSDWKP